MPETPIPAQSSKPADIIKLAGFYTPTMSSIPGMPLEVILSDLQNFTFACDQGELFQYSNENQFSNNGQNITMQGDDMVYWRPGTNEEIDGSIEQTQISVTAQTGDGTTFHQTLRILSNSFLYCMIDVTHQREPQERLLPDPQRILLSDGSKTMVFGHGETYFEQLHAAFDAMMPEGEFESLALEILPGEVELWKSENEWIELYYAMDDLKGIDLGNQKGGLTDTTRLLSFLDGEFVNNMMIYKADWEQYGPPIYTGHRSDSIRAVKLNAIASMYNQTDWLAQDNGTKVRLYTSKLINEAGEDVAIRIEVKNDSEESIEISTVGYKTLYIKRNGVLIAEEIGTDECDNLMTIMPRHTVDFVLTHVRTDEAGTYSISGHFGDIELPEIKVQVE